jgi:hypothetical protein
LSVAARGLGGERPLVGGRRERVAIEALSRMSMLRGVVRARRKVVGASLVRGLMEPMALLMLLCCDGECFSRPSAGADSLLPMMRCVDDFFGLWLWLCGE